MAYVDFMSINHKATQRDYLARVNDPVFPKHVAAERAKQWGYDYWDGDRRINYGGHRYIAGWWQRITNAIRDHYHLESGQRVLDVGCGKGFMLYDLTQSVPGLEVHGLDISEYALEHAKPEIREHLIHGTAAELPFPENHFDLVISTNTLHNLHCYDLDKALREIERVGRRHKYICVESYGNEREKANLLYWQVTCESFYTPAEWEWWFKSTNYTGDYSFIYFE